MYCILVTGAPASGKSTMAGYLSEHFRIPVISKDLIKEKMYDEIGFNSRAEKVKLGNASMEIMYYVAEQFMNLNQPFILENNFEHVSKEGLFAILEKYSYTAVTVRMTGDYEKIYERFAKRDRSPERHRGHVVNDHYPETPGAPKENPTLLTYEGYLDSIAKRGFDTFVGNGPCIEVDTTDIGNVDRELLFCQVEDAIRTIE